MEVFERDAYEADRSLLPEVPACGRSIRRATLPGLDEHAHPDAFEICLIADGEVEWWAENQLHQIGAGEAFITRPGETHGAVGGIVQPCELLWFQLHWPEGDNPDGFDGTEGEAMRRRLQSLPRRTFKASLELQGAIRRLIHEHRERRADAALLARAALHTALVLLTREAEAATPLHLSTAVEQALRHMAENLDRPLRLADLSQRVGLSQARLQARFREALGCSVAAYDQRLRLHRAKVMLAESGTSITEVAVALGFSSSQYFATAFRAHTGLTPTRYRRLRRAPLG